MPKLISEFNRNLSGEAARIDQVLAELIQLMACPGAGGGPLASINTASVSQAFSDRLDRFVFKLGKTLDATDTDAIKFGSLGSRTPAEAFAFLAIECPPDTFGLMIDPRMVLEHVFANINGINVLKSMETLHKIKLTTISEGFAISSFERDIPKFSL
jgi:hypothetical protein